MKDDSHTYCKSELESELEKELLVACKKTKEIGYNPTRFIQMLKKDGGIRTAEVLVSKEGLSEGFVVLWEKGRLDLTIEAIMQNCKYKSLFSNELIKIAEERLKDCGYDKLYEECTK